MTTNHPVPTPPPSEPAPSLRPVEELQALCDRATPPPWNVGVRGGIDYTGEGWSTVEIDMPAGDPGSGLMLGDHELNEDDAAFIAAARTALPSLLARLRAAEEARSHPSVDGGLWIHRSLDNREATEPKEIEMTHIVNTSRELHVGQKVTVSFEAEITEIPETMDYSDTVTVQDADNRLLLLRVQARNVHPHEVRP